MCCFSCTLKLCTLTDNFSADIWGANHWAQSSTGSASLFSTLPPLITMMTLHTHTIKALRERPISSKNSTKDSKAGRPFHVSGNITGSRQAISKNLSSFAKFIKSLLTYYASVLISFHLWIKMQTTSDQIITTITMQNLVCPHFDIRTFLAKLRKQVWVFGKRLPFRLPLGSQHPSPSIKACFHWRRSLSIVAVERAPLTKWKSKIEVVSGVISWPES